MEHTARVLRISGPLPPFVSLLAGRLLGLHDARLFQEQTCFEVGHGAIPVLDWLASRPVGWENLKLYEYEPAFAEQIPKPFVGQGQFIGIFIGSTLNLFGSKHIGP